MTDTPAASNLFEIEDSPYAVYEHFYEEGWTDGLPIIPPTEELVRETLRYTDRAPDDVVGKLPPRGGAATMEKIAINAVMAGCAPDYLPVLIAAVEAIVEPQYNLYGRQTTTHPGAHLVIIHGPVRHELDVNCRQNVFGQGWRANATIGRALRLLLINVGGGVPGVTDMATHGHPGKYSYCIGEDEEGSPWPALHVDRGFDAATSAVTVTCAEPPHNVNDMVSMTPEMYLDSAASTMAHLGANGLYRSGLESEQMLVMTAEAAQWLDERGWKKDDVKRHLFESARAPVGLLRGRGGWGKTDLADFVDLDDDSCMAPIVPNADGIVVVVAGGHGRHMNAVLNSSYSVSVTKPIARKNGAPVGSVREFLD
jgi:hypothetical protein